MNVFMDYVNSEYLKSGGDPAWKILKQEDGSYSISAQSGYYGGNSARGAIRFKPNLAHGTYKMSYEASNTHPDGSHTTCIMPMQKGDDNTPIYSGSDTDNYVHNTKAYYEYTFVVDDNFDGFQIGWWSYYRTTFKNVELVKIE